MPCWPKLVSITAVVMMLNWAQHVENTAEYTHWLAIIDPGDTGIIRNIPEQSGEN